MFVVDSATIRAIDAASIEAGVMGVHLMEEAGAGAARMLLAKPDWLWGTTLVLCGSGNNGGDGLVVARLLKGEGHEVRALLLQDEEKYRGDVATNLVRAREAGVPLHTLRQDAAAELREIAREYPGRAVVDGILGTGFRPPLRGRIFDLVEAINSLGRRVLALDAPSGLDASTGAVDPVAVRADLCATFGLAKWGLFLPPGRGYCGTINTVALPFPEEIVKEQVKASENSALYVNKTLASGWWKPRAFDAHKYSVGSLLVVGGSTGMSGAVSLASLAALRSGAGLVEALVPGSQRLAVDANCLEVLVRPMPETGVGTLSPETLGEILERSERHSAVLLGPGLGADLQTAQLAIEATKVLKKPMLVDADGLNAFARLQTPLRLPEGSVITPHTGELRRLLGEDADLAAGRVESVRRAAEDFSVVLLHKGAPTMVASPDGAFAVIASGNSALASAGTGDVLSGVIAALLAAGYDAFEAACLGAWMHGTAGERVSSRLGEAGLLARDLLEELGPVGLQLQEANR